MAIWINTEFCSLHDLDSPCKGLPGWGECFLSENTVLCHCPEEYIWSTLSGSLVRNKAKIWLATCMYLYFPASGLEYGKVWKKGQRFMKSRQEVILEVIECIDVQESMWTQVPSGYSTHSRRIGLHILPQAHSVLSSSSIPECHSLTSMLRKRNTIYPATIFWNSTSSEKVSLTIHSFKLPQGDSFSVIQCLPSGCVSPWLSISCLTSWVVKNGLSRLFLPF